MRFIQVFNKYLFSGGEENSAGRIARHLRLGGHEVIQFWRASSEWSGPQKPPRLRQAMWLWNNRPVLDELKALHEQYKPHAWILHNVVPVISLGCYPLAKQLGVPVIQWLHNYRPISPSGTLRANGVALEPDDRHILFKETLAGSWRSSLQTAWLSLCYLRARKLGYWDHVIAWIAVSNEMRSIFLKAGWPTDKTFALHHSWDISPAIPSNSTRKQFLFLGRMIEEKGVRFLVDLWTQTRALDEVSLLLAGEGNLRNELQHRSPPNVTWLGHISGDEKKRIISESRAVLFPGIWPEPLSTIAYEAYEQCRPMLASSAGGMKEVVFERKTGRILPPNSTDEWRGTILELVRNPTMADEWGRAGRNWLECELTPRKWNSEFSRILAESGILN